MQVKTPRFYVDYLSFLNTAGGLQYHSDYSNALGLNMQPFYHEEVDGGFWTGIQYNSSIKWKNLLPTEPSTNKVFIAILGHNLKSNNLGFRVKFGDTVVKTKEILNGDCGIDHCVPYMDGATIVTVDNFNQVLEDDSSFTVQFVNMGGVFTSGTLQVGGISMGVLWDAPNAPDMNIKLSRIYDGVNIQQSIGGSKFATASYIRANQAFEMGGAPFANARTGKRSWAMKFSYVNKSNLLPENELLTYGADINGDGVIQADSD